jgi:hypothetical protein
VRQSTFVIAIVSLVLAVSGRGFADEPQQPKLSRAEQAAIAEQVGKVKPASDREVIKGWSNAKKVAEFICRPAALRSLAKQDASVDKVFLGTNDPSTLSLQSAGRLTGTGQYRKGDKWMDIDFVCDIDPDMGKVSSFQWMNVGASSSAPAAPTQ